MTVPNIFQNQTGPIPLVQLDENFAAVNTVNSIIGAGAVGNGIFDNTTIIQNAINSLPSSGGAFYFPAGNYLITGAITVTVPLTIYGDGKNVTIITQSNSSADHFTVTSTSPVIFKDIKFDSGSPKISGAGVHLSAIGANSNLNSIIINCSFNNLYYGVWAEKAMHWISENCDFTNSVNAGIYAQNTNSPENGAHTITNCFFSGSIADNILVTCAGGIYSKIWIENGVYGIRLLWNSSAIAGNTFFINQSKIVTSNSAIYLDGTGTTSNFGNVSITETYAQSTANVNSALTITGNTPWLVNLCVTGGNQFITTLNNAGTVAIVSMNYVVRGEISGNTFRDVSGIYGYNLIVGNNCSGIIIGDNQLDQLTGTGGRLAYSFLNTVATIKSIQSGSTAITTSTAFPGGLFSGTTNVVFPIAFKNPPRRIATNNSPGSSGISCSSTNITTTGFTLNSVSSTSGANTTIEWSTVGGNI